MVDFSGRFWESDSEDTIPFRFILFVLHKMKRFDFYFILFDIIIYIPVSSFLTNSFHFIFCESLYSVPSKVRSKNYQLHMCTKIHMEPTFGML